MQPTVSLQAIALLVLVDHTSVEQTLLSDYYFMFTYLYSVGGDVKQSINHVLTVR